MKPLNLELIDICDFFDKEKYDDFGGNIKQSYHKTCMTACKTDDCFF